VEINRRRREHLQPSRLNGVGGPAFCRRLLTSNWQPLIQKDTRRITQSPRPGSLIRLAGELARRWRRPARAEQARRLNVNSSHLLLFPRAHG